MTSSGDLTQVLQENILMKRSCGFNFPFPVFLPSATGQHPWGN